MDFELNLKDIQKWRQEKGVRAQRQSCQEANHTMEQNFVTIFVSTFYVRHHFLILWNF